MATVFILAGFDLHETAADAGFAQLRDGLTKKGYSVVPVAISWRHKTISQYLEDFKQFYKQHKTDTNIVIGNSFGAVIAFLAAPVLQPDSIYLCSLSPFFKEDRRKFPDSYGIKYFGKRRMEDLWSYSADEVAKVINQTATKTFVVYGEKEYISSPNLVSRCRETADKIKGAVLTEVAGAPHDMSDDVYSAAIINMLMSDELGYN
ncbi:MAG: hypothetical protein WA843_01350 [Candidatus Saccharimonadales bacterium]